MSSLPDVQRPHRRLGERDGLPDVSNMQRPRRRLGEVLRELISCPLCAGTGDHFDAQVRIVRWRERTVRVECITCGLRFSLDIPELVQTLRDDPDALLGHHLDGRHPGRATKVAASGLIPAPVKDDMERHKAAALELADWIERVHEFAPSAVSAPPSRKK